MKTDPLLLHSQRVLSYQLECFPVGWHRVERHVDWLEVMEWAIKHGFHNDIVHEEVVDSNEAFLLWTEEHWLKTHKYWSSQSTAVELCLRMYLSDEAMIHFRLSFGD